MGGGGGGGMDILVDQRLSTCTLGNPLSKARSLTISTYRRINHGITIIT